MSSQFFQHRPWQCQKAAADIALTAQPQDVCLESLLLEAAPSNDTALERFTRAHRAMEVADPEAADRPVDGLVVVILEAKRQPPRHVPGMLTPLARWPVSDRSSPAPSQLPLRGSC